MKQALIMKIRIKGNTVRYRLTKTEVANLATKGLVEEQTEFNEQTFTYALQAKEGIENLDASFKNNTITIFFPSNQTIARRDGEQVGHHFDMPIKDGKTMFLLVEKDFVCLDETHEDQGDNYPNPLLSI